MTIRRHRTSTMVFHWGTLIFVFSAIVFVLLRRQISDAATRITLLDLHRSLGMVVYAATVFRVFLRVVWRVDTVSGEISAIMRALAKIGHAGLYTLMIILPLVGWAMTNAGNKKVMIFGLFALPEISGRDRDLADTLSEWHVALAWVFITLVAAHAAAALYHHYVRRDGVLRSMLPERIARRQP